MSWTKKIPQEAPGTIFETQGRTPANGFLKEREPLEPYGGWAESEYQSGPDRIVKSTCCLNQECYSPIIVALAGWGGARGRAAPPRPCV
jgi:hypothetical protein